MPLGETESFSLTRADYRTLRKAAVKGKTIQSPSQSLIRSGLVKPKEVKPDGMGGTIRVSDKYVAAEHALDYLRSARKKRCSKIWNNVRGLLLFFAAVIVPIAGLIIQLLQLWKE